MKLYLILAAAVFVSIPLTWAHVEERDTLQETDAADLVLSEN